MSHHEIAAAKHGIDYIATGLLRNILGDGETEEEWKRKQRQVWSPIRTKMTHAMLLFYSRQLITSCLYRTFTRSLGRPSSHGVASRCSALHRPTAISKLGRDAQGAVFGRSSATQRGTEGVLQTGLGSIRLWKRLVQNGGTRMTKMK
jgi:hypothetical protein